ncbi:DNA-3-methyladenine glycosylase I [Lapidilactobacillus gannanensis]|jgi:DNA-3-methyladenine glycosylase I|uniref:DNA-3-methyladenine glycosylase I n=1 Tax=Lapidilactobacillus gannanensis TaxID=2486002 RepID=A0ABW4BN86_9LACO|nr:DNA-3-methyladenine glycosylase I [Lapidilactobacillus gannanensis]MCH4056998.1 DNA-3-methyladenine glycosylase I [Lactobacillaceae bacterium]
MGICPWALTSPEMKTYHDQEWGHPEHDSQKLFELLSLETYQAGLSWQTVLNKRAAFRRDFADFSLAKVAAMTTTDIEQLLTDTTIIRNRQKLMATVNNAQVILALPTKTEFSDFNQYLWHYVDGKPQINYPQTSQEVPAQSRLSQQISADLKKLGFKFVGPTICYSFLQAVGMIDDHLVGCPAKSQV